MNIVKLSSNFQISIPKQIRERLGCKAGQQFVLIPKGNSIYLVPIRSIKEVKGILPHANTKNYRYRKDRI